MYIILYLYYIIFILYLSLYYKKNILQNIILIILCNNKNIFIHTDNNKNKNINNFEKFDKFVILFITIN